MGELFQHRPEDDCVRGLHSFRTGKRIVKSGIPKGHCRYCNAVPIDWERLYRRDIGDIDYLVLSLKREDVRFAYWCEKEPTFQMVGDVVKLSRDALKQKIVKRLRSSVSKPKSQNAYDGRQTPLSDNLIYWAQHACGTCCRACLEQWHGIGLEQEMTGEMYDYLAEVMLRFIGDKISMRYV